MSLYPCYDDAHDPKYGDPHPVPIVMATAETLKGYGTIITDFVKTEVESTPWPVTGRHQLCPGTTQCGVRSREFVYKWVGDRCTAVNKAAIAEDYVTGRLPKDVSSNNRTHFLVREANYHPNDGQVFFPTDKTPFVALLAVVEDEVELDDFQAFYFDGSFGFQIHPNIWHQPVYPINTEATFLEKHGEVHTCINVDTVKEFGKYLKVPLEKPE